MNTVIAGGGGFVGTALSQFLLHKGYHVVSLGTTLPSHLITHQAYRFVKTDTTEPGPWQAELNKADIVINLAGKNIFKRWTPDYKDAIYRSRVHTTKNLVDALPANSRNTVFLSTSAAGFYGDRQDDVLDETQGAGTDFLARVCKDWEKEAGKASKKGARTAILRFGVILGRDGGALAKMVPAFRFFVGGPIGNGRQWFPWMHMQDLLAAIQFIIHNDAIDGPVNCCGVQPATNRELARAVGTALKRPSFMPAPSFMIRLLMGELGNALLFSQRTVPTKLLTHGFSFQYPTIRDAVANVVAEG
jgi:uncharacterized protein (TIGR01777 family)